jgi:uncharacterized protein (TIGR02246 family)
MCASRPAYLFVFAAVCASSMGCSRDTRAADEAAIRAVSREWNDAETAKDLEKCLSFYAQDGEWFATGSALIVGAAALRKEWQKYLAAPGSFHWTTSKVEVSRSGDLGYETGKFVLKTIDKNQQTTTMNGKYVLVWKKQTDGKWKVVADIDNPDT